MPDLVSDEVNDTSLLNYSANMLFTHMIGPYIFFSLRTQK